MKLTEYIYSPEHYSKGDSICHIEKPERLLKKIILPKTTSLHIHKSIEDSILSIYKSKQQNYIANLSNVSVVSHNSSGSISVFKNKIKIKDLSTSYNFKNTDLNQKKIKEKSVLLSMDSGSNYFHWMCQIIPRIKLLYDYGLKWSDIGLILTPEVRGSFVDETLSLMNVPQDIVFEQRSGFEYIFDNIIIPSCPNKHIHFSKWSLDFVKSLFISNDNPQFRKIYVTRDSSFGRNVLNEPEVWEFLQSQGYERHSLANMSVKDQAALFNSASHVICPHGADLTNLIFCQPDTNVIELFNPSYFSPLYWSLCNQLDYSHAYLIGEGMLLNNDKAKKQSVKVSLSKLKKLLFLCNI
jgi:capsular polysaccharide biosynthesis protein